VGRRSAGIRQRGLSWCEVGGRKRAERAEDVVVRFRLFFGRVFFRVFLLAEQERRRPLSAVEQQVEEGIGSLGARTDKQDG